VQLGFVSAILPDLTLSQVFEVARNKNYNSVELMCWPPGKADRRYAGVTHIDVTNLTPTRAEDINNLAAMNGVNISGLGYYPNPLAPSEQEQRVAVSHLKEVIRAARMLGLDTVSTFIGRNWRLSVDDNWPLFLAIWPDLIRFSEDHGIRIAIENRPMSFTIDEWPGGKNLASSPALWDRMFEAIPSKMFGLNYDPSHQVWQGMDYIQPLTDYAERIFRIHLKDAKVDTAKLNRVGILAHPLEFHSPILPGQGDIDWHKFFAGLRQIHYDGFVTVEVEDKRYEGDLQQRECALEISAAYLRPFLTGLR
jgi:sugar phosphate isomerase/epimerase